MSIVENTYANKTGTSISRGPGKIERAIVDVFANQSAKLITLDDLIQIVFGIERKDIEEKHGKSVKRAASKVADRLGITGLAVYASAHQKVYARTDYLRDTDQKTINKDLRHKFEHRYLRIETDPPTPLFKRNNDPTIGGALLSEPNPTTGWTCTGTQRERGRLSVPPLMC